MRDTEDIGFFLTQCNKLTLNFLFIGRRRFSPEQTQNKAEQGLEIAERTFNSAEVQLN